MSPPLVLLLRSCRATDSSDDPYVAALQEAGFRVRCVPVLRFEFADERTLQERMSHPEDFDGLILTSPRAARALEAIELRAWREHPVFVVGPATAAAAQTLGLSPMGEEAGSAEALAGHIAQTRWTRPLLFLCGDRRRDVLPDRLRAAGIEIEEQIVYRTLRTTDGLEAARMEPPDWVVFFSPSGVGAVEEEAADLADPSWNRTRKAAIGPTTASALRAAGMPPDAIAASPTPGALVAALLAAHRTPDA